MRFRCRTMLVTMVAAALVAAGCGGGDDVDPAEDRAAAEAAMEALEERLRDDGFEPARDDDDDDTDIEFESEECREFAEAFPEDDDELPGETASEEAELERGELDPQGGTEESVSAAVAFVEDEGDLDAMFELLADDRLSECLEEAMQAEFENQAAEDDVAAEVSDLRAERRDLDDVGDEAVAVTVEATLGVAGFEFPFDIEFALAREGRTVAMIGLFAIGEGEASQDAADLLSLLLEEAGAG